jgi:hypothetical protein
MNTRNRQCKTLNCVNFSKYHTLNICGHLIVSSEDAGTYRGIESCPVILNLFHIVRFELDPPERR